MELAIIIAIPAVAVAVGTAYFLLSRKKRHKTPTCACSTVLVSSAELEVSSDTVELENICDFIRTFCSDLFVPKLDEDSVNLIELAANEAASFIMRDAYKWNPNERINVQASAYDDRIEVTLFHTGASDVADEAKTGISPSSSQQLTPERLEDLGLYIVEKCVDTISKGRDDFGRNYICLTKHASSEISAAMLQSNCEYHKDVLVIHLSHSVIDFTSGQQFMADILPFIRSNTYIVFDLTNVKFLDSSGLGSILFCLWQLRLSGGDLKMYGISKRMRNIFEAVRMDKVFDIYESKEHATAAFSAVSEKSRSISINGQEKLAKKLYPSQ